VSTREYRRFVNGLARQIGNCPSHSWSARMRHFLAGLTEAQFANRRLVADVDVAWLLMFGLSDWSALREP
jgi:hypothetical protein